MTDEKTPHRVDDSDKRGSKALGLGFAALFCILGALVLGVYGATDFASERQFETKSSILLIGSFLLLTLGLLLAKWAQQVRTGDGWAVPSLRALVGSILVAGLISVVTVALADGLEPRAPSSPSAACPLIEPTLATSAIGEDQLATFVFPDEAEGKAGLSLLLGRARPRSARADGILVRQSGQTLGTNQRLQVVLSELRRDDGTRLNRQSITVWATMINERDMNVTICFNPLHPREVSPGRYTGRLTVIDPRATRIDVPVVIEMQFDRWPILVVVLIGTLLVATFILYNGVKQLGGRTASLRPRTLKEFGTWAISNPVAIGTGVVAGVAVFINQYLADPAWSGRTSEVFALIGAIAASFIGAATVAAGVGPRHAERNKNAQDEAEGEPAHESEEADQVTDGQT